MKPIKQLFSKDKLRMAQWLFFAALFYGIAAYAAFTGIPEFRAPGVVAQRLGHITLGAFVGYWIDRNAFKFAPRGEDGDRYGSLRRAAIISASILAISTGG